MEYLLCLPGAFRCVAEEPEHGGTQRATNESITGNPHLLEHIKLILFVISLSFSRSLMAHLRQGIWQTCLIINLSLDPHLSLTRLCNNIK